jgi:hypothetical protein
VLAPAPTAAETDSAVHPMSDYEKFVFDLKGFIVIPSVLTREETRNRFEPMLSSTARTPKTWPRTFAPRWPDRASSSSTTRACWGS